MEVHELLAEFGFDENTPIVIGSALYALEVCMLYFIYYPLS